ncbi:hypothetical protein O7634_01635 [Micromonospora sp. WMMD1120]|uniref:hypothetical protein n=1 Tax=Micromonospora sp. WMMD1120 TaxID=3016106 RepID=UPI002417EBBB|nr:hypothetical protein [Micromonospora sp. WMMD1120]MDG4805461.1 hypothetical protein [Micromonospora sp. WMMD1120]
MSIDAESGGGARTPSRPRGARRPALAIVIGLATGLAFGAFVHHSGIGRSSDFGSGSIAVAAVMGLLVTAGAAWTMFHKGW